jgi:hypothetical protein
VRPRRRRCSSGAATRKGAPGCTCKPFNESVCDFPDTATHTRASAIAAAPKLPSGLWSKDSARNVCGTLLRARPRAAAPRPLMEFQSKLHCSNFGPKHMRAATTIPPVSSMSLSLRSSSSKQCHSLFATASRMPPEDRFSKFLMKTASGSSRFVPSHAHKTFNKATEPLSRSLNHA